MRGRTGTSTIYTTILPKQSYLNRICTTKLSKETKHRFNPRHLESLEDKSRRPHHTRTPQYDYEVVKLIRKYREDKDTCAFSAKKLSAIIKEDYPNSKFCISAATIGRLIFPAGGCILFFTVLIIPSGW